MKKLMLVLSVIGMVALSARSYAGEVDVLLGKLVDKDRRLRTFSRIEPQVTDPSCYNQPDIRIFEFICLKGHNDGVYHLEFRHRYLQLDSIGRFVKTVYVFFQAEDESVIRPYSLEDTIPV